MSIIQKTALSVAIAFSLVAGALNKPSLAACNCASADQNSQTLSAKEAKARGYTSLEMGETAFYASERCGMTSPLYLEIKPADPTQINKAIESGRPMFFLPKDGIPSDVKVFTNLSIQAKEGGIFRVFVTGDVFKGGLNHNLVQILRKNGFILMPDTAATPGKKLDVRPGAATKGL